MVDVLTTEQMRQFEKNAFAKGVDSLLLMEDAARGIFDRLSQTFSPLQGKTFIILCGPGNNGGDGAAVGRLLKNAGASVRLFCDGAKSPQLQTNLDYFTALGGEIQPLSDAASLFIFADVIIDALYGTGFRGQLDEQSAALSVAAKRAHKPVWSIDIPSGLNGDTGRHEGCCFHADVTLCLGYPKTGLLLSPCRDFIGQLQLIPLCLPEKTQDSPLKLLEKSDLTFNKRPVNCHKGLAGRVAIFAGSPGMAGAAAMAAKAALKAGAGLVTVLAERSLIPILQTLVPNAMCRDIDRDEVPAHDVLIAGCGIGQGQPAGDRLRRLLAAEQGPVILDADGLNLLAQDPFPLPPETILTPHIGEAARLLGTTPRHVSANKLSSAREILTTYGASCVVLKSDVTLIADSSGALINALGSPSLSKGGSGDALCGIIAALIAEEQAPQKPLTLLAARGCMWLGLAGEEAENRFGDRCALTGDVLDLLPAVWQKIVSN